MWVHEPKANKSTNGNKSISKYGIQSLNKYSVTFFIVSLCLVVIFFFRSLNTVRHYLSTMFLYVYTCKFFQYSFWIQFIFMPIVMHCRLQLISFFSSFHRTRNLQNTIKLVSAHASKMRIIDSQKGNGPLSTPLWIRVFQLPGLSFPFI